MPTSWSDENAQWPIKTPEPSGSICKRLRPNMDVADVCRSSGCDVALRVPTGPRRRLAVVGPLKAALSSIQHKQEIPRLPTTFQNHMGVIGWPSFGDIRRICFPYVFLEANGTVSLPKRCKLFEAKGAPKPCSVPPARGGRSLDEHHQAGALQRSLSRRGHSKPAQRRTSLHTHGSSSTLSTER